MTRLIASIRMALVNELLRSSWRAFSIAGPSFWASWPLWAAAFLYGGRIPRDVAMTAINGKRRGRP